MIIYGRNIAMLSLIVKQTGYNMKLNEINNVVNLETCKYNFCSVFLINATARM